MSIRKLAIQHPIDAMRHTSALAKCRFVFLSTLIAFLAFSAWQVVSGSSHTVKAAQPTKSYPVRAFNSTRVKYTPLPITVKL